MPKLIDADIPTLHEDPLLKISWLPGDGPFCVINFIGVGHHHGGIDSQSEDFKKLDGHLGPRIFVFDKTRSWGNKIEIETIKSVIAPHMNGRRIVTLGVSMGGFLAVAHSEALGAETCIALAPQYSMKPDIVPHEQRWQEYTSRISEWKIPSLEGRFASSCRYYCMFTGILDEAEHMVRFPPLDHVHRFCLPGQEHNTAAILAKMGLLYPFIQACLDQADPEAMPLRSEKVDGIHFVDAAASRNAISS
jgi:hypothetical protein